MQNNNIKVLHVVYGGTGGAARIVIDIARVHNRDIYEPVVVLVGYQVDEQYVAELQANGIVVEIAEKQKKWDLGFLCTLRRIIRGHRPKVVLFHTPVAHLWGRTALLGLGIKLVIAVEHVAVANYYGRFGRIANIILSHLFTDQVVCVSEAVKSITQKELCLSEKKLKVIENGIPLERVPLVNQERLLLEEPVRLKMVSRLEKQKDPATLIMAVKKLREEGFNVHLDFVGDGSLLEEMRNLARQVGVDDIVSFLGRRNDVPELLQATDIFVLSTHAEGLPISLLEAMAAGLPCIATSVPGVVGVVANGVSGLLVPENDSDCFIPGIGVFNSQPADSKASRRWSGPDKVVEEYSIQRTVREYECMFENALKQKAIV